MVDQINPNQPRPPFRRVASDSEILSMSDEQFSAYVDRNIREGKGKEPAQPDEIERAYLEGRISEATGEIIP